MQPHTVYTRRVWRLSRTQVLPNDITHLCQEIRHIKRGSTHNDNIGQINKLKRLSKHLSNTPDLDWGKHDKDGLDYVETEYNTPHLFPPINNPDNPSHYGPPRTPGRPESSGTPSAPLPPHASSETSARTSSLASSNTVEDPKCQGRQGDHQAEVRDDTWTMRVGEVGTDQHNTILGNWRRDLTEGQSFVTCSDLRYPTADMRGGGSTGGQEELWGQRSS